MGNAVKAAAAWFAAHRKSVTAVAGVAVIVIDDVATSTAINWQTIIIAVLAALGVYALPNSGTAAPKT